jgi:hypothetical protein
MIRMQKINTGNIYSSQEKSSEFLALRKIRQI